MNEHRTPDYWNTGLPSFNQLVVAYLVGAQEHSGVTWKRDGFAFMVRHHGSAVVANEWSSDRYADALKALGADYLEVTHWMSLERPK